MLNRTPKSGNSLPHRVLFPSSPDPAGFALFLISWFSRLVFGSKLNLCYPRKLRLRATEISNAQHPTSNIEHRMKRNEPLHLDEEQVRKHLRMEDLIPAMEKALIDFSAGKVTQPVRSVISV